MRGAKKILHLCILAGFAFSALSPGRAEEGSSVSDRGLSLKALSPAELAEMSGGASPDMAVSAQTVTAVNSGNSIAADSIVTGNVNLQSGALNGFSGIGNFVFNTGNNNNLQGTLSVTILTPTAY